MYKKYLNILFLVILSVGLTACNALKSASNDIAQSPDDYRYGIEVNGKSGFINRKGEEVIKPQYDYVGNFSEGLAEVGRAKGPKDIDGGFPAYSYGFIDTNGKLVIKFSKETYMRGDFSEGLAAIMEKVEGKTKIGFINKLGQIVIKPQFDEVNDFSENLAVVQINNKWGYINTKGDFVIKPIYDEANSFSDGLAIVKLDEKYGAINKKGEYAIPLKTNVQIYNFSEGVATRISSRFSPDGFSQFDTADYIDTKGNVILNPSKLGYTTFINDDGDWSHFSEGLLLVLDKKGYWRFINKDGITVFKTNLKGFPNGHDAPVGNFTEGLSIFSHNTKFGYLDKTGKIAIKPEFSSVASFDKGLAYACKNNDTICGYIDKTGKFVWSQKATK